MNDEISMSLLDHDLSPLSASCAYSEPHFDDYDGLTRRERILLRPWLENLIDSGHVPGLEWLDRDKYVFKVPWKHRSKKTWSVEHSSVFLEWAKNTGRWREGDPEPNYAQLKTRLRCAFNKAPDIQEIKELHKTKCEDAYKVYRFIPKKESRFGNFKKKMLIPTSIKKRHFSWMSGSRFHGPMRRMKQEDIMEPVPQIKMEPPCGSLDGYCEEMSPHGNLPYNREDYRCGPEESPMNPDGRASPQPAPPPPPPPPSLSLPQCPVSSVESYCAFKYQKPQLPAEFQQERSSLYPNGNMNGGLVQLQAFSEIAAEQLSRRANNCGNENTLTFPNESCGDANYGRNFEKHQLQNRFHSSPPEVSGKHAFSLNTFDQGIQGRRYGDSPEKRPANVRMPSFSDASNHRRLQAAYTEENRNAAIAKALNQDQMKISTAQYGKMYPASDKGSNAATQQYHASLSRIDQDKLGQNHEAIAESSSSGWSRECTNLQSNLSNQMHLNSEPPPLQPRRKQSSGTYLDGSEASVAGGFANGHHHQGNGYYSRRPPLEPLVPKAASQVEGMVLCGVASAYQETDGGRVGKSQCSMSSEGGAAYFPREEVNFKEKDCQDQMPLLTGLSKPAGTNVLDLTKKVKMAVAPFISHRAQQQQSAETNNDSVNNNSSTGKSSHSKVEPTMSHHLDKLDKLSEHLNSIVSPDTRVLDLIEWERRLIERERELLARERLMTLKEKNLRELELAFHLNKIDPSGLDSNPGKNGSGSEKASSRQQKSNHSSPPPLSPLRNSSGMLNFEGSFNDPRWPRKFYKGDAFSSGSTTSDESDVYYSHIFGRNCQAPRDVLEPARAHLQNCALFINNGGRDNTSGSHSPDAMAMVAALEEARRKDQSSAREMDRSDGEFGKVLPVVNSLNSDDVLHIAKLPEKIPEDHSGDDLEVSCHFISSSSASSSAAAGAVEKDDISGKEFVCEEVWKRRMKWMSFQGLQNNASQVKAAASHWIWPSIGNLGQQQEQSKLDDGGN